MSEKIDTSEIVNLGTGISYKIKDVIGYIQRNIPGIKIKKERKGDLFEASCADMRRFRELTGWKPEVTLEEGIKKVYEYERNLLETKKINA